MRQIIMKGVIKPLLASTIGNNARGEETSESLLNTA